RLEEAEHFYRQALAITENTEAPRELVVALGSLAAVKTELGDLPEAERLLTRALEAAGRFLPAHDPETGALHLLSSTIHLQRNLLRRAERSALRGLTIMETSLGSQHPDVLVLRQN